MGYTVRPEHDAESRAPFSTTELREIGERARTMAGNFGPPSAWHWAYIALWQAADHLHAMDRRSPPAPPVEDDAAAR